jgi:hypothetical protein
MKNQVLNKTVCCMMKNFNAALTFSIYNKEVNKRRILNIVTCFG